VTFDKEQLGRIIADEIAHQQAHLAQVLRLGWLNCERVGGECNTREIDLGRQFAHLDIVTDLSQAKAAAYVAPVGCQQCQPQAFSRRAIIEIVVDGPWQVTHDHRLEAAGVVDCESFPDRLIHISPATVHDR
jgi:hypothetical protein